jgi:hypothetical protein
MGCEPRGTRNTWTRPVKQYYLFRGRIRCAIGTRKMDGSPRKHAMYYRCPARTLAPESRVLATHPAAIHRREDTIREAAEHRLVKAEAEIRRFQAAIAEGIHPTALVEAINTAQAEQAAAQGEINNTPAPDLMEVAEAYARIDSLRDVPETSTGEQRESRAELHAGTDLRRRSARAGSGD